MALYRITYRPELGRPAEDVEADSVDVEGTSQVVLRQWVTVIGTPRDVVVRRLRGADVLSVDLL